MINANHYLLFERILNKALNHDKKLAFTKSPVPQKDENENEKKQNTHATFNL